VVGVVTCRAMTEADFTLAAARAGDQKAFAELVAPYQRELRAYCYRMAGSLHDAEDLLQESLLRAWRGLGAFEGRSSLRTWLYRVTWSACLDTLEKKSARALVVDSGPPADPSAPVPPPGGDDWIGPCPAALYADEAPSPEARYSSRESVALAFLAALQLLPPRQRAALIARDVLGWSAEECAELLGASVASTNSALQRARQTIDERASRWRPRLTDEQTTRNLLARYVEAWEQADVGALVSLLHHEATLSMPPLTIWLASPQAIGASIGAMVLTPEARGAFRFLVTESNGLPALAAYRRDETGRFMPSALHVLSLREGRIDSITAFLDPGIFEGFGLPPEAADR
jgi:RNA polymerase sigma-70 factor, ECF subfamily